MKFTTTLLALALAAVSFCQSAGPSTKPGAPAAQAAPAVQHKGLTRAEREKIRDEVLVEMKVSTENTVKIKDLDNELRAKQKEAHKADKGLSADDKKKAAKELRTWYEDKLKGILGEADFKTFNKLMHEKTKAAREAMEAKEATPAPATKP